MNLSELLADETKLRRAIAEVLTPGPLGHTLASCHWREGGRCYYGKPERLPDGRSTKICPVPCDIRPEPLTDPMEVLVWRLVGVIKDRCIECETRFGLQEAIVRVLTELLGQEPRIEIWKWFSMGDRPEHKAVCCLVALDKATIPESKGAQ